MHSSEKKNIIWAPVALLNQVCDSLAAVFAESPTFIPNITFGVHVWTSAVRIMSSNKRHCNSLQPSLPDRWRSATLPWSSTTPVEEVGVSWVLPWHPRGITLGLWDCFPTALIHSPIYLRSAEWIRVVPSTPNSYYNTALPKRACVLYCSAGYYLQRSASSPIPYLYIY